MRRIFYLLILLLYILPTQAQPTRYGNEWIDYSRIHYKIKITTDGMYRIPKATLDSVIPNAAAINPADFIMYHNGLPIPIYVKATGGTLDSTSYIEFYGKKNIGDVDSVLFFAPGFQPSPYYSFMTDTSIYFLSTRSQPNNPRLSFLNNDTAAIPSLIEDLYFMYSSNKFYTSSGKFSGGRNFYTGTDYLYKSIYDEGEAWGSNWINYGGSALTITLPTPAVYTAGPAASVNVNVFTRSWEDHNIVTTFNSNPLQTLVFNNQGLNCNTYIRQQVPATSLVASNSIKVTETASSFSGNQNLVMFSEIVYPHKFDFGGSAGYFLLLQPGSGQRYFRVSNFAAAGTQPLLYDLTNGYIVRSTDAIGAASLKFVLPPSGGSRELFLRADVATSYNTISHIDTVTFRDYTALGSQGNFIIVTNTLLTKDSLGHNWVEDYRVYRDRNANPISGKYDARVFDIDQLIDQFAYGVRKSPLAIRNFVEYAYDRWTKKPEYLFVIGKGRDYRETREGTAAYDMNLVPTFGRPASDNLLTCRRGSNRPLLAVGRLAARTGSDVENYLDKVKTYEAAQNGYYCPAYRPDKLWMKQIMHFGGGESFDEQITYRGYLEEYERIARDTLWGANIFGVYKTSSAPIDFTQAQAIQDHIDSGTSLMTLFGHAAATAQDIYINPPETWHNFGKYPIVYSNGCFAGSIHDNTLASLGNLSYSERYVLTPGKGSVAFTATTGLSISGGLYYLALSQYNNIAKQYYLKPWGKALQSAIITQDSAYGIDPLLEMVAYDMTLHGDPALMLNQQNKPDYEVDNTSVYFTPQNVDANIDSFRVNVIITNLGRAIKDSIQVSITRTYPNPSTPGTDTVLTYKWRVKAPYYIDTVSIKIPTFPSLSKGFGLNRFFVFVESEQHIDEMCENNNGGAQGSFETDLEIQSDDVIPIYPTEFAIVPKQNPTLKASTVDPFARLKNYKIQIDTSELFVHPLAVSTITQTGGVVHWTVPFTFTDSTVYYWRVSRDSINDTLSYKWHYSSFLYLKDEYPGWNQSHYYQYKKDRYSDTLYLDNDRVFKYVPIHNVIHVNTGWCKDAGGPNAGFVGSNLEWDFNSGNAYRYRMGGCGYANPGASVGGFTFAVIDTVNNHVWTSHNQGNNYGQYGNIHCNGANAGDQEGFDFNVAGNHPLQGIPWSKVISNFLDSIPNGSIVLMYAVSKIDWPNVDSVLMYRLMAMGGSNLILLRNGTKNCPYTFFCMKGNPALSGQAIGVDYTTPLEAFFNYNNLSNHGSYQSTVIGPAQLWGSFHWRWRQREQPTYDKQSVDIYGIQPNGTQTLLLNTQTLDTTLNFVNPTTYPFIQLTMHTEDDTAHSPSQLYYWRVLYKKVPEAAINPNAHFVVQRDTIGLGDSLNIEVALENVTDLPMDSMRTLYTVKSLNNGGQQTYLVKSDSLRAFDTQILKFKQPITNGIFDGKDRMVIEANPLDNKHQLEQYHFNNYAVIDFSARGDKINPLLDVTFDGKRIMSGDIVSAKPQILITLKDENKYLALDDTALAQVYIRYPGQASPTLLNYDNNIMTFYPATGNLAKRNQAKIELKPTFTLDGTYELLIKDRDKSNNYSSTSTTRFEGTTQYDYKTTFDVITRSMVTNVLNYPNPFSTRTQFVFTLTGSDIPDYMKIQIMTITGKVVKEITKAELGNLRIGINRTDYYWDGRDEFGDKLANGVYFYRVITNIAGRQVENMNTTTFGKYFNNTNIDKYFKNGFGKMVIMR